MNNYEKNNKESYRNEIKKEKAYFLNSINYSLNRSFVDNMGKHNNGINNSDSFIKA